MVPYFPYQIEVAPGVDFGKLARRAELAGFQLSVSLTRIAFNTLFEHHADFKASTLFDVVSLTVRQQDQEQEDQQIASTVFVGLTLAAYRVTKWDGDKPKSFTVADTASYLFDQVSLLCGLSEFARLSAPIVWVSDNLEPGKSVRLTYKAHLEPQLEEGLYTTQVKVYALDRSGFAFETNESELDVKVERHILLNITPQIPELQTQKTIHSVDPFTVFVEIENVGVDT